MTEPEHPSRQADDALLQAVQALLLPLARLLLARGVHFGVVEEQLKAAMVQAGREAALQATPGALPHRLVSRISTATGINRREVTRLAQTEAEPAPPRPSLALRVYFRWTSDPGLQGPDGLALPLRRQGPAPSFDALAASVTKDVHPRSLLDDMIRLKVVEWDAAQDMVRISRDQFVPSDDIVRLFGFLGSNVGDHLSAAVENVTGQGPRHFEQALHATGLSAESLADLHALVEGQWKHLTTALVPTLQARIDADEAAGRDTSGRVRIGLYTYSPQTRLAAPARAPGDHTEHDHD